MGKKSNRLTDIFKFLGYRRSLFAVFGMVVLSLFFFPATTGSKPVHKLKIWTIHFTTLKKAEITLFCEVAATPQEQNRGLMFRESLGNDECMIFVYDRPLILKFWMRNTVIPLSIGFIDEKGRLMETYDMKPNDENIIQSTTPVQYAVEVNLGWYKQNLVYSGSTMRIEKRDTRLDQ